MYYTVETVYIQPTFYNVISSPPAPIVYLQTPYSISSPQYVLPRSNIISPIVYAQKPLINHESAPLIELPKQKVSVQPVVTSTSVSAEEQLEINLAKLGYRRQFINGDGNCFFTAVASQLIRLYHQNRSFRQTIKKRLNLPDVLFTNQTQLARTLRKCVCIEWKINSKKYRPYVNDVNYTEEVRKFRSDKFYSSILGDILPLTMSNLLGLPLKLITNLRQCPVIDVTPDDDNYLPIQPLPVLLLAYNQENEGHYDVAIEKNFL